MIDPSDSGQEIGLFEAMYSARAMRWLKPDAVPASLIARILEAATRAPSAGNSQKWLFVVVRNAGQRRRIGEIYRRVSLWVLQRHQHVGKSPYQSQAQYDLMMKSAMHLYAGLAHKLIALAYSPETC